MTKVELMDSIQQIWEGQVPLENKRFEMRTLFGKAPDKSLAMEALVDVAWMYQKMAEKKTSIPSGLEDAMRAIRIKEVTRGKLCTYGNVDFSLCRYVQEHLKALENQV